MGRLGNIEYLKVCSNQCVPLKSCLPNGIKRNLDKSAATLWWWWCYLQKKPQFRRKQQVWVVILQEITSE